MARLYVLIVACLALFGCAIPPAKTLASKPCPDAEGKCELKIIVTCPSVGPCTPSVDFEEVRFANGKRNIKVKWTAPSGYAFCPTAGDGVFLKQVDPDDQFDDPKGEGHNTQGRCNKREFGLVAKNTKPRPNDPYYYKVIFHNETGTELYVIDPIMINE